MLITMLHPLHISMTDKQGYVFITLLGHLCDKGPQICASVSLLPPDGSLDCFKTAVSQNPSYLPFAQVRDIGLLLFPYPLLLSFQKYMHMYLGYTGHFPGG